VSVSEYFDVGMAVGLCERVEGRTNKVREQPAQMLAIKTLHSIEVGVVEPKEASGE
jgi:hypothetical protein